MEKSSFNLVVIIAGIDEEYQNDILTGIEEFAAEECVNISVFVSFSGVMGNHRHDVGEFNIFRLPDFSLFDGAVLLTNTIAYQPVIDNILRRIRLAGIPAVSIDNDIQSFYHIGIDNGKAMREITEHFISKHKCRCFNYVSGPVDNPESQERLDSFLAVLEENNITIESERIYYGDFRSPSGRDAIEQFMKSDLPMPDAIICANDVMALSVMTVLNASGFKIPEDIKVSGFDDTFSARNFPTELTSVERPLKKSGLIACKTLINHLKGIDQKRSVILDMHPHFTESCGCTDNSDHLSDVKTFKNMNYSSFKKVDSTSEYVSAINRLSCQLIECDSLNEFSQALKPFIREIGAEEFYLCICSDWNLETESCREKSSNFTVNGYTNDILVPISYRKGRFTELKPFSSGEILPGLFDSSNHGKMYYFIPLHFRERCLGYIAILNSKFPLQSSLFQTWCITISNMLENIRKIISLDLAVQKLNKLYTVDTLTGIYNRNGFVNGSAPLFKLCVEKQKSVMLMFIDMDGLKQINDNHGHSAGDDAIHGIANVIAESCVCGEVYCRFGGDEFIIFGADFKESDADALTARINRNIKKYNDTENFPFNLSASIGYHIAVPKEGEDIFNLVTVADDVMYKEKKRKKTSKYLKSPDKKQISEK